MAKEPEEATGYLFTHVDCPACGYSHELEGDKQGEEYECECGTTFLIRVS